MKFAKLFIGAFLASTVTTAAFAADVVSNTAVSAKLDYANAKPMPLPRASIKALSLSDGVAAAQEVDSTGTPAAAAGSGGDGKTSLVKIPASTYSASEDIFTTQNYGGNSHPYTTSHVDPYKGRITSYFPFRAAGKLFFQESGGTYVCSASLIKRGLVVTAAHCVADFGQSTFYTGHQFMPGYYVANGTGYAPYGIWTADKIWVLTSYYNGTDPCYVSGVVCQDDVAVIALSAKSSTLPGTSTGWFGYGYNSYGFINKTTLITQLGYPVALDNGGIMERTDSLGYMNKSYSYNTIIGSQQTGGSSGGPWLINLGIPATITGTASTGLVPKANVVVGVTSWGYTDTSVQEQGASPFLKSNIGTLVTTACTARPAVCQ